MYVNIIASQTWDVFWDTVYEPNWFELRGIMIFGNLHDYNN